MGAGIRAALLVVGLFPVCMAQADTHTWNGGGANNNWNTASNWGGVVPVGSDALVFGGTNRLAPNNNLTVATIFSGITFSAGAGAFTLSGNSFNLSGDIVNNSSATQTLSLAFLLYSGTTRAINTVSGDMRISGAIGQNGSCMLSKQGAGKLTLSGNNSYDGGTVINGGTVAVSADGTNTHNLGVLNPGCGLTLAGGGLQVIGDLFSAGQNWLLRPVILGAGGGTIENLSSSALFLGKENFTETAGMEVVTGGTAVNGLTLKGGDIIIRPRGQNALGKLTVFSGRTFLRNDSGNRYPVGLTDSIMVSAGAALIFTDHMPRSISNSMTFAPEAVLCTRTHADYSGAMTLSTANAHFPSAGRMFFNYDDQATETITLNGAYPELTGDLTFQVGGLNATVGAVTVNGPISGNYALAKTAPGTLILNAINTYTGGTTVSEGVLDVRKDGGLGSGTVTVNSGATLKVGSGSTQDYIHNSATLFLSGTANLGYAGTDTIKALSFNGGATFENPGTWGALTSTATYKDSRFTGAGLLNVIPDTCIVVASSLNPSTFGEPVTFTATVAVVAPGVGIPGGTVQFRTNSANFGAAVGLSGGGAVSGAVPATFPCGSNSVMAIYIPSGSFNTSTGMLTGGQVVTPWPLSSGAIHLPRFEGAQIGLAQPPWPNQTYWVKDTNMDQYARWSIGVGSGVNGSEAAVAHPGVNANGSDGVIQDLRVYYFPVFSNTPYSVSFFYKAIGAGFTGLGGPNASEMQLLVLESPNLAGGNWLPWAGTNIGRASAGWTRGFYPFTTQPSTRCVCLKFGMFFGYGNQTNAVDVFYLDDDGEAPNSSSTLIRIQ